MKHQSKCFAKKPFLSFAMVILLLTLVACSGNSDEQPESAPQGGEQATVAVEPTPVATEAPAVAAEDTPVAAEEAAATEEAPAEEAASTESSAEETAVPAEEASAEETPVEEEPVEEAPVEQAPVPLTSADFGSVKEVAEHTIVLNEAALVGNTVRANFTIENKGASELSVSSILSFEAKDGAGTLLEMDIINCGAALDGAIPAGGTLTGDVCWTTSADAGGFELAYVGDFLGTDAVTWSLSR